MNGARWWSFGVPNIFILVVSFHILFGPVRFIVGFNIKTVRAIRYRQFTVSDRNAWECRSCSWGETHSVRLHGKQFNTHGEDETNNVRTMTILSSATAVTAVFLLSQPVMAMDNLLGGIPISTALNGIDPRYFLSGCLCASFSHGITTPIDVVKTRIQSDPRKYDGLDILQASTVVWKDDGYGAFFKGFGPTVMGYGLEGAAKFGLYESLKPTIAGFLNLETPGTAYVIASVIAGGAASVILCPLERTRIRLVTDTDFSDKNIWTGMQCLIEESGVASLFYGLPAMLSKQCPYTLGKQVTYDAICSTLYSFVGNVNEASTKVEVSLLAACCASVVACVLSQPGDVILTETYKEKNGSSLSTNSFSRVISTIYTERDGVNGFYTGLVARLIQVGGIITSQLLLYDFIKQSLGLPATGSS